MGDIVTGTWIGSGSRFDPQPMKEIGKDHAGLEYNTIEESVNSDKFNSNVITSQVDDARSKADEAYKTAIEKLDKFGKGGLNVSMPDNTSILANTTIPEYSSLYENIASKLNAVDFPETEDEFPDPSSININLQKPEGIKNVSENVPDTEFLVNTNPDLSDLNWQTSDKFEQLEEKVRDNLFEFVRGKHTGISPEVEQAIYNRSKSRLKDERETQYKQAEDYFAARGFPMPPGALAGRLSEIDREHSKRLEELNNDIMTKQAELEQTNRWKAFDTALSYGQFDFDRQSGKSQFKLSEKQQKLAKMDTEVKRETAKIDSRLRAFSTEYSTLLEVYKGEVEYERARVQAKLEKMNSQVQVTASKVDARVKRVEAQNNNNANIMQAYKVSYDAANAQLDGYLRKYSTEVDSELKLIDAKYNKQAQEASNSIEINKQVSEVAAQLAASALSALNISTTMGYSEGVNLGHSTSFNYSASQAESFARNDNYSLSE